MRAKEKVFDREREEGEPVNVRREKRVTSVWKVTPLDQ